MACRYNTFIAVVAALVLSSCSLAPVVRAPEMADKLPEQFEMADGLDVVSAEPTVTGAATHWWTSFSDPALNALVDSAMTANLDVRIAAARVLEVQQAHRITRSAQFPGVQASASAAQQNTPTNLGSTGQFSKSIPGFPDRFDVTTYSASLALAYELDVWGRARSASLAALSEWIASQADYQAVQMGVVAEVISTYFEIRDLQSQLSLAGEKLGLLGERLQLTRSRYERGLSPSAELYSIQQSFEDARSQYPLLEAGLFDARSRLALLLGTTSSVVQYRLVDAPPSDWGPAFMVEGLPSDLIKSRPDVIASAARMEAMRQVIGVRRAEQFPSFSLTASGGRQSSVLGDLLETSQRFWLFGGSLAAPVFGAGARRAAVRAAWARYEQAEATYEKNVLTAFRDVSAALTLQAAHKTRIDAARLSLVAADAAHETMTRRYVRGVGDYVSLIDARLALIRAQLDNSSAIRSSALSRLTLYRAVGGSWFL